MAVGMESLFSLRSLLQYRVPSSHIRPSRGTGKIQSSLEPTGPVLTVYRTLIHIWGFDFFDVRDFSIAHLLYRSI